MKNRGLGRKDQGHEPSKSWESLHLECKRSAVVQQTQHCLIPLHHAHKIYAAAVISQGRFLIFM